jgi:hypothetical protein
MPLHLRQQPRGSRLRHPQQICRLTDLPGFRQQGHQPQMAEFQPALQQCFRSFRDLHNISAISSFIIII